MTAMHGPQIWSDPVIRSVSVRSGLLTVLRPMKSGKKLNGPVTRCFLKTDKSWTDDRSLTKIGLSANIYRPCNNTKNRIRLNSMEK